MQNNRYNFQQALDDDPSRLVTETWREYEEDEPDEFARIIKIGDKFFVNFSYQPGRIYKIPEKKLQKPINSLEIATLKRMCQRKEIDWESEIDNQLSYYENKYNLQTREIWILGQREK